MWRLHQVAFYAKWLDSPDFREVLKWMCDCPTIDNFSTKKGVNNGTVAGMYSHFCKVAEQERERERDRVCGRMCVCCGWL